MTLELTHSTFLILVMFLVTYITVDVLIILPSTYSISVAVFVAFAVLRQYFRYQWWCRYLHHQYSIRTSISSTGITAHILVHTSVSDDWCVVWALVLRIGTNLSSSIRASSSIATNWKSDVSTSTCESTRNTTIIMTTTTAQFCYHFFCN